jgi:hypothetical protein
MTLSWTGLGLLDEVGFNIYEKKALAVSLRLGVADAATLCREGDIPTSKIYEAMERLSALGLVEIQPTRPKLYSAAPPGAIVDRLVAAERQRSEEFAARAESLRELLERASQGPESRQTFAELALGVESHVKRHLTRLATARRRILSYLEEGDLRAIESLEETGFGVLRRISRAAEEQGLEHRVIFGFSYASAPRLTAFLRRHGENLAHVTGVRYAGELGHPFHLVDDELVILALDHPFVPDGRFASILVRDHDLAAKLAAGFEELWNRAMRDLGEVRFMPSR